MAALGLDPFRFLYSRDMLEQSMLVELSNRALEIRQRMDKNLAIEIANAVGKLFSR